MTDTTVVSTEDGEMSKVREIFERALNAIVQASQLSKDMAQLRSEFNALHSDVENLRQRNTDLDNELASTREQRDQYLRDKHAAIDELNQVKAQLEATHTANEAYQSRYGELSQTHETLKREHDNVQLHNMELEEELKQVKAAHEKIKAALGIQPRDVTSGKWQSPGDVQEPAPEQADTQRTGTGDYWR